MKHGFAIALLATARAAHATAFFEPCESALKTPAFNALQVFYAGKPELPKPDACFRLNNREFLVVVADTAPIAQGLYFFDARTGSYDFPDGAQRRGISVAMEFDDRSGKHFALLKTSALGGGEWFTGYQVLLLQRGKGTGSFALQKVIEVQPTPNPACAAPT
ncbi:hypothetical protein ACG04R_02925 [Roseateles sp. BYS78W]|uniref:Uncharacterized protein n=1 Tax=Pelomonas candidula TaxID=3299025 RepID=A0ABW7H6X7_9BURK